MNDNPKVFKFKISDGYISEIEHSKKFNIVKECLTGFPFVIDEINTYKIWFTNKLPIAYVRCNKKPIIKDDVVEFTSTELERNLEALESIRN